jgi:hypothetical protein
MLVIFAHAKKRCFWVVLRMLLMCQMIANWSGSSNYNRQGHFKAASLVWSAFEVYAAVEPGHQFIYNAQAKTDSTVFSFGAEADLVKSIKDLLLMILCYSDAFV